MPGATIASHATRVSSITLLRILAGWLAHCWQTLHANQKDVEALADVTSENGGHRNTEVIRWHHEQMAPPYGSSAVLKSPRYCTMLGVVDETRRTYRHHGRQRDAPRRIATFRHATLRVATHRYATLEPLGKPGGSRAFSADGPPQ